MTDPRRIPCPTCGVQRGPCRSLTSGRSNTDTHKTRRDAAARPRLTIGELFAGYGGLGLGVARVLDVDLVWYADVCKFDKDGNAGHHEPHRSPCSILEHHNPGVPNLGDVSRVDWTTVPRVDVLTGGSPCQDLSHAGKRAGMTDGTRSNLWVAMREAIAQLRPSLVVWENVRGALNAPADSAMEPCPGCVGDGADVGLRALGRVLGDLADLGYDAVWACVRASDVGACHERFRVFVAAFPADSPCHAWRLIDGDDVAARPAGVALPTPLSRDWKDGELKFDADRPDTIGSIVAGALLPTPAVNDMGAGKDPDEFDAWRLRQKSAAGDSAVHGKSLDVEARRMMPTPLVDPNSANGHARDLGGEARRMMPTPTSQAAKHGSDTRDRHDDQDDANLWTVAQRMLPTPQSIDAHMNTPASERGDKQVGMGNLGGDAAVEWGDYEYAVKWWAALTRPAPAPAELNAKGKPRLSPRFSEWMMGLPDGWVTDVPGIRHTEALKALGNGVVPQQAEAALRAMLLAMRAASRAAA